MIKKNSDFFLKDILRMFFLKSGVKFNFLAHFSYNELSNKMLKNNYFDFSAGNKQD